jgi:hypothetical protein
MTKQQIELLIHRLMAEQRALHKEVVRFDDPSVKRKSEKLGRTIREVKQVLSDLSQQIK